MGRVGRRWVTPVRVTVTARAAVPGGAPRGDESPGEPHRGQLLRRQCEAEVIAPRSVDVEVAAEHTLLAEPELDQYAQAGGVLGAHRRLQPVQPDRAEAVVGDGRDSGGD